MKSPIDKLSIGNHEGPSTSKDIPNDNSSIKGKESVTDLQSALTIKVAKTFSVDQIKDAYLSIPGVDLHKEYVICKQCHRIYSGKKQYLKTHPCLIDSMLEYEKAKEKCCVIINSPSVLNTHLNSPPTTQTYAEITSSKDKMLNLVELDQSNNSTWMLRGAISLTTSLLNVVSHVVKGGATMLRNARTPSKTKQITSNSFASPETTSQKQSIFLTSANNKPNKKNTSTSTIVDDDGFTLVQRSPTVQSLSSMNLSLHNSTPTTKLIHNDSVFSALEEDQTPTKINDTTESVSISSSMFVTPPTKDIRSNKSTKSKRTFTSGSTRNSRSVVHIVSPPESPAYYDAIDESKGTHTIIPNQNNSKKLQANASKLFGGGILKGCLEKNITVTDFDSYKSHRSRLIHKKPYPNPNKTLSGYGNPNFNPNPNFLLSDMVHNPNPTIIVGVTLRNGNHNEIIVPDQNTSFTSESSISITSSQSSTFSNDHQPTVTITDLIGGRRPPFEGDSTPSTTDSDSSDSNIVRVDHTGLRKVQGETRLISEFLNDHYHEADSSDNSDVSLYEPCETSDDNGNSQTRITNPHRRLSSHDVSHSRSARRTSDSDSDSDSDIPSQSKNSTSGSEFVPSSPEDIPDDDDYDDDYGDDAGRDPEEDPPPYDGTDPNYPIPDTPEKMMDMIGTLGKPQYLIAHAHKDVYRTIVVKLLRNVTANATTDRQRVKTLAANQVLPGMIIHYNELKPKAKFEGFRTSLALLISLNEEIELKVMINRILTYSYRLSADIRNKESKRYENGDVQYNQAPKYPTQKRANENMRNSRLSRVMNAVESAGSGALGFFTGNEEITRDKVEEMNPTNEGTHFPNDYDDGTHAGKQVDDIDQIDFRDREMANRFNLNELITPTIVKEVLRTLPKDSANGVSSWTFNILKYLFYTHDIDNVEDDENLMLLTKFLKQTLQNELPKECYYLLTSARQVLIMKTETKVRPISIGDIWFRLAGKVIAAGVNEDLRKKLVPYQLCTGVRGGTEIGARIAQSRYDDEDTVIKSWDGTNAFSTMSRRLIQEGIMNQDYGCNELAPFFQAVYGQRTELRLTTEKGRNRLLGFAYTGVLQGDPLGGVLYALGIHKTLLAINKVIGNKKQELHINDPTKYTEVFVNEPSVIAYADDACAGMPIQIAIKCNTTIEETYHTINFPQKLNPDKGLLLGQKCNEDFIRELIDETPLDMREDVGKGIFSTEGAKILGVQIGNNDYITESTSEMMDKRSKAATYLNQSGLDYQTQFALLSKCINARPWYTARSTAPALARKGLQLFDNKIDEALALLLKCNELTIEQKLLRGLPKWCSGMGIARADGPQGHIAYKNCNELCGKFINADEYKLSRSQNYMKGIPDIPNCTQLSSCGYLEDDLYRALDARNQLLKDPKMNYIMKLYDTESEKPLIFNHIQEENNLKTRLVLTYEVLILQLLKHIVDNNIKEITDDNRNDLLQRQDTQKINISVDGIEKVGFVLLNRMETKQKLAWLLSGISTPNSTTGTGLNLGGGQILPKFTTWNLGGLQLNWTGKPYNDYYRIVDNGIFAGYLKSRLYSSYEVNGNVLLCPTDQHRFTNNRRVLNKLVQVPAANICNYPLHGLLCRGTTQPGQAASRHGAIAPRLIEFVKKIVMGAQDATTYDGNPIGTVDKRKVETGQTRHFMKEINGRQTQVHADIVITLNHNTINERIILIDLTIREPHTEKFVFSEKPITQGEAAIKGDTEKENTYRFLTADANMNCRLFYLSLESNGHVSEKTHDLFSLLKSFGSSEGILSAMQKNMAGAVAYKNGTALAKKYHDCYYSVNNNNVVGANPQLHEQEGGEILDPEERVEPQDAQEAGEGE